MINTVGIMFDGDGERESFPTLIELANDMQTNHVNRYSLGELMDADMFGNWLVVAYDPRPLMYGDDDREAMDETNFDALLSNLSTTPVRVHKMRGSVAEARWVWSGIEEAREAGAAIVEGVLIIAPRGDDYDAADMDDQWNMATMRASLADYPLLDEEAYSEREYAAWMEYAPMALSDEIADARRAHVDDYASESALDEINEHADELLPILAQHLHYEYGFSGDYGPNFLVILGELMRQDAPTDDEIRATTTAQDLAIVRGMFTYHTAQWITRTL